MNYPTHFEIQELEYPKLETLVPNTRGGFEALVPNAQGGFETIEFQKWVILAIGAHPDDAEYGCGGTLAKYVEQGHSVHILTLSRGETLVPKARRDLDRTSSDRPGVGLIPPPDRLSEAIASAKKIGAIPHVLALKDTYISDDHATVSQIETFRYNLSPNLVFVNYTDDTHQDHRNVARAVLSAFRRAPVDILFYETPSTLNFSPTIYVTLTPDQFTKKLDSIAEYKSQGDKSYLSTEFLSVLAAYRAQQTGDIQRGYAEAFMPFRIVC